jgi:exopolysaccharide biosynthesis polyprenyl glycosylphosphotransferase
VALVFSGDVVALAVAAAAGLAVGAVLSGHGHTTRTYVLIALTFILSGLGTFTLYGLHTRIERRIVISAHDDLRDILHALGAAAVLTEVVSHLAKGEGVGLGYLTAIVLLGMVTVPLTRAAVVTAFRLSEAARVLIVGTGAVAGRLGRRLTQEQEQGVSVVGYVDNEPMEGWEVLGRLDDLPRLCEQHKVNRVLVAFSRTPPHETAEILRRLSPNVSVSVVPRLYELVCWRSQLDELQGIPVMDVAPGQLSLPSRMGKRAFDVLVSSALLLALSPVLVTIALAIKLTSHGPVLFLQRRSGRQGKTFRIMKFRTMRQGAELERETLSSRNEVDGPLFKVRDDPRQTRVGRFLRRTSLDELAQLFNVLRGDMSLVGPRPFVVEESEQILGWAARRLDMRPGITGLWQVSGRNDLSYSEMRALDYAYVSSWSFWWDVRILTQTPVVVLKRRGAH